MPIGCTHLGAKACAKDKLRRQINWCVERDNVYSILMGDMADFIVRQDSKRFRVSSVDPELVAKGLDSLTDHQVEMVIDYFKKYAETGRILGAIRGNHEDSILQHHSTDVHMRICDGLGIKDLGYSAFIRLTLQKTDSGTKRNCVIYAHHGYGSSRRSGSSVNRLEDTIMKYDCDIVLQSHDHQKLGKRFIRLHVSPSGIPKIRHKPIIVARTGTFLRTAIEGDTTYSEKAGYPPTDIGVVKITANFQGHGKELDLHVSE